MTPIPTRRTLLLGLGAALAAPAVVKVVSLMPIRGTSTPFIWGDGIHDDAPGLNAALGNRPFIDLSGRVVQYPEGPLLRRYLLVNKGRFKVNSSIRISKSVGIHDSLFDATGLKDGFVLDFSSATEEEGYLITNNTFDLNSNTDAAGWFITEENRHLFQSKYPQLPIPLIGYPHAS